MVFDRVGPLCGAVVASIVYEICFRPVYKATTYHRDVAGGVGMFPGSAGVQAEETGVAGDALSPIVLNIAQEPTPVLAKHP